MRTPLRRRKAHFTQNSSNTHRLFPDTCHQPSIARSQSPSLVLSLTCQCLPQIKHSFQVCSESNVRLEASSLSKLSPEYTGHRSGCHPSSNAKRVCDLPPDERHKSSPPSLPCVREKYQQISTCLQSARETALSSW